MFGTLFCLRLGSLFRFNSIRQDIWHCPMFLASIQVDEITGGIRPPILEFWRASVLALHEASGGRRGVGSCGRGGRGEDLLELQRDTNMSCLTTLLQKLVIELHNSSSKT